METIPGENNLLLTCRREETGVTVTRAESWDARAAIPDTVWGLPVTAIGHHAFTPGPRTAEGEQVRFTCGPETGQPDNRSLRELTLPDTVTAIGDYALFRCAALEHLTMGDRMENWGGCVFMNCRVLSRFTLRLADDRAVTLCHILDELSRELDVTLRYPDGGEARLIFPEYQESYEENGPAHHFDYNIFGAGYPYHHSFRNRTFDLGAYDRLWPAYLGTEHDPDCALRMAWWRLRTPRGLKPEAAAAYLAHLRGRAGEVLDWLLTRRDMEGLNWFLDAGAPDRETLSGACETARRRELPEAQALLLESLHRRFPADRRRRFEL